MDLFACNHPRIKIKLIPNIKKLIDEEGKGSERKQGRERLGKREGDRKKDKGKGKGKRRKKSELNGDEKKGIFFAL